MGAGKMKILKTMDQYNPSLQSAGSDLNVSCSLKMAALKDKIVHEVPVADMLQWLLIGEPERSRVP